MAGRLRHRDKLELHLAIVTAAILTAALGGCTGLAVGAGATMVTAAVEERGVTRAASDLAITTNVTALWIKYDPELVTDLDITVSEGRALLTGTVETQNRRLDAFEGLFDRRDALTVALDFIFGARFVDLFDATSRRREHGQAEDQHGDGNSWIHRRSE